MNPSAETKIEDIIFSVVDVETTGLSSGRERICEVAVISYKNFSQIRSFSTLVNPGRPIPPEITSINGINDDMVKDKPSFGEIIPEFIGAIESSVLVGHNVNFDKCFLENEFHRNGFRMPAAFYVDTLRIARKFGKFESNRLGNIAKQLKISNENWHRAFSDVEMTGRVFEHFLMIFKKEGVTTLGQLLKRIGN